MASVSENAPATPAPGYILVRVQSITDPERYDEYRRRTPALLAHYGARYIVKGYHEEVVEGEAPERFTIIEFPSLDSIHRFWRSDEYAEIRAIREGAAIVKVGFLDGHIPPTSPGS